MVVINAVTGKRRRQKRRDLPRKKRNTLASTPAAEMFSKQAMENFHIYILTSRLYLVLLALFMATPLPFPMEPLRNIRVYLLAVTCHFFKKAVAMLRLDSELMDVSEEDEEDAGYRKQLEDITLDSYENDDECEDKTRFTKDAIRQIIDALELGEFERVYYDNGTKYYKFRVETLLIYLLRKMSTARTHKDLADNEFGGCSKRWGAGYNYLVKYMDTQFASIIGPQALSIWVDEFPYFAEKIRQYMIRDKIHLDHDGNVVDILNMPNGPQEGDFNIFSVTDCTVYEICRPGSGPANAQEGAPRQENWYIRQRAFYDGYHRGMEACLKILTICLPNGMTGAVYGPTSGRDGDRDLFRLSEIDDILRDLCLNHHGGDLYCTYGDGIFAGYWHCLRTRHEAPPNTVLTQKQQDENENMKAVRESVEWSYARAEQLWPLLNKKDEQKLEVDSRRCFAEVRVMYLLTNFKVCESEGSTMTGVRGFQCPPPTLEEYLAMVN